LVDSSRYGRTITVGGGSAAVSTSQQKFGSGSLYLPSNSSYFSISSDANAFYMSDNFTIEWWQYLTSYGSSTVGGVISGPTLGYYFRLAWNVSASNSLTLGVGSTVVFTGATPTANQWQHIAISRTDSTNRLYIDGALVSTQTDRTAHPIDPAAVRIGFQAFVNGIVGYVDDFRWTCGSNRGYTGSTITVPTAAFPDSQGTSPFAVVLTKGETSFTVPAGFTSMKAWAIGGGGSNGNYNTGGAGGCAYKTWSVSAGNTISMSIGAGGPQFGATTSTSGQGGNTTVTFGGVTITGQGGTQGGGGVNGTNYAGGSFSGGDGGATGGTGFGSYYTGDGDYYGGAVGGNGVSTGTCKRRIMTDISGLKAALTLAGMSVTETCGGAGSFGAGSAGNKYGTVAAGIGGGGGLDNGGTNWTTAQPGGNGAVVLYFS
jgi:hypothetical protein